MVAGDVPDISATYQAKTEKDSASGYAGLDANTMLKPAEFLLKRDARTSTSEAITDSDRGKIVTFNNTAAVAVTIAQAGAASAFADGWYCWIRNIGTGTATLTPATSTIEGAAVMIIPPGASCMMYTDGSNYFLGEGSPFNSLNFGYMLSDGRTTDAQSANNAAAAPAANTTYAIDMMVATPMLLDHATISVATGVSNSRVNVGVFDTVGNKIIDSGVFTCTASSTALANALSQKYLLLAGIYKFAWCSSTITTLTLFMLSLQQSNGNLHVVSGSKHDIYTCGNAPTNQGASNQALPTTLGTLTVQTASTFSVPLAVWEA